MNKNNFLKLILTSDYDFLRENQHLGNNICYLTLGGSYAYGLETPTSDIDIRGVALPSKDDIIGFGNFEQIVENYTDTTVYSLSKFIHLCLDANPNVIELLNPREDVYEATEIGQQLIDMRHNFFSRRAGRSFGGYAHQQLRRLENALCHDRYDEKDKKRHLFNTMHDNLHHLKETYKLDKYGSFDLHNDDEITAYLQVDGMPFNNLRSMFNEINEVVKTYNKLNGRNHKKDDFHLNKHACHLVRLYLMGIDLFEKEEIITYRKDDIELLMSIRNGKYMKKDGTYESSFFEMVDELEKKFNYAYKNTSLPDKPNQKAVKEFIMDVNTKIVKDELP